MIKTLAIFLLTVLFANLALAQQSPHYLLTSTPLLELGQTLTGELSLEDGQNFKDGARLDMVKIYLDAGEVVEFSLNSDFFDTYLTVFDAEGRLIGSNDDTAENSNSHFVLVAETAGRYMLVVSGYSELDMGDYDLSATRLELSDDSELSLPTMLSGILDSNDENLDGRFLDAFSFSLSETTRLSFVMTSNVLDSYLIVVNEEGSIVAENDDDDISLDSYLELELEPGNYTLFASSSAEGELGFYQLSVDMLE